MLRRHEPFCLRDSMPSGPNFTMQQEDISDAAIESQANNMTWQQQTAFGAGAAGKNKRAHNRTKHQPFDITAEDPATKDEQSWSLQQAWVYPTDTSSASPDNSKDKPDSSHASENQGSTAMVASQTDKMSKLTDPIYIPPYLRKREPVAAKQDSAVEVSVSNGSPSTSKNVKKDEQAAPTSLHPTSGGPLLPPSPPITPREPQHLSQDKPSKPSQDPAWDAWGAAQQGPSPSNPSPPDPSAPAKKFGKPNWPRGPEPPRQKHVWIKQRDIKPQPSESSDGGIKCTSDSGGDPDYDIKKLVDWEGNWMPVDPDWAARRGFSDRHFGPGIEMWINGHNDICTKSIDVAIMPDFIEGKKDLVPPYWAEVRVEDMTLRDLWKEMPNRSPDTLSDIDVHEHPPWWDRFDAPGTCFVNPLLVPDASVDVDDHENYPPSIGVNAAMASANEKVEAVRQSRIRKEQRRLARQNRPVTAPILHMGVTVDRRLKSDLNMYIRPVQAADTKGITEIYNYYLRESIHANEFEERTPAHIGDRIKNIVNAGLPHLVAVAKGGRSNAKSGYVNEKIVGYISLDDYCDQSSMYRYTFEMDLLVHPGFIHKGIGKCLIDRLLEMCSPSYNARGGYQYVNNFDYLKFGPTRVIKTILLQAHHEHGEDTEWMRKYLDMFKFKCCGHISQIGFKKDKAVDITLFQHHTTEPIDAKSPPRIGLVRG